MVVREIRVMRFRGRLFNLSTSSIDRTIQSSLMLMHHNLTHWSLLQVSLALVRRVVNKVAP